MAKFYCLHTDKYHVLLLNVSISVYQAFQTNFGQVGCISAEWKDLPNECPGYDTKQSDGEALVILELWGMQITHLLSSFPGPL